MNSAVNTGQAHRWRLVKQPLSVIRLETSCALVISTVLHDGVCDNLAMHVGQAEISTAVAIR